MRATLPHQKMAGVLDARAHPRVARRRVVAVVVSLALHASLAVTFVVAPVLAARRRPPVEYVAVKIVPVQALGVREPAAEPETRPEPRPSAPPKPRPSARETERKSTPTPPSASARQEPSPPPAGPAQRQGSPLGRSGGTSPFGGTVAGLDNPDFVYTYYTEQMLALIGSHWVRPPVERPAEAIIRFRIGREGEVSDIELVQSSGHTSFDLAALRAVRQAAPLPPLPRSFTEESLGVRLHIR